MKTKKNRQKQKSRIIKELLVQKGSSRKCNSVCKRRIARSRLCFLQQVVIRQINWMNCPERLRVQDVLLDVT